MVSLYLIEYFSFKKVIEMDEELNKEALDKHKSYQGKIEVIPKCPIKNLEDFSLWYTPGVAAVSRKIKENKDSVFDYTNKWNNVAVVSDGSRVLGLGDVGPYAGLPVMEGKCLLFKYLGGVDAFPICLNTKDPKEIIKIVKSIQPTFGGINLEDISKPKCFEILDSLRKDSDIPVWHDDQQGTATVILAGLINALKIVGKKMNDINLTIVGAGAAGMKTTELLIEAGVDPKKTLVVDTEGILNANRSDLENSYKWGICLKTNPEGKEGGISNALKGSDVCISLSRPGPDVIKKEWVSNMSDDSIVFACANPVPEILPKDAKEGGARIVATGRSDFPNQINNSLGFPGIFRGVLDVRAEKITDTMCLKASHEIAKFAEEKGLKENYIVPNMSEWKLYPRVAVTVGMEAMKKNIAKKKIRKQELYETSGSIIKRSREIMKVMMEKGLIE